MNTGRSHPWSLQCGAELQLYLGHVTKRGTGKNVGAQPDFGLKWLICGNFTNGKIFSTRDYRLCRTL
jgi:hypothetical protein